MLGKVCQHGDGCEAVTHGCCGTAVNVIGADDELLATDIEDIVKQDKPYAWEEDTRVFQGQAAQHAQEQSQRLAADTKRAKLKDLFSRNRSFRQRKRRWEGKA